MHDEQRGGLTHPLPRRTFLKTLLGTAAAGTIIFDGAQVAHADSGPVTETFADGVTQTVETINGRNVIISRIAKDGLLPKFVAGTLVATSATSVTVYVPLTNSNIEVEYTPTTRVTAGGSTTLGDISACNVGDRLNMGTYFGSSGFRIAEYIRANVVIGNMVVTDVDETGFTGYFERDPTMSPYHIDTRAAVIQSSGASTMAPGDACHVFATSSSPNEPESIWGGLVAHGS